MCVNECLFMCLWEADVGVLVFFFFFVFCFFCLQVFVWAVSVLDWLGVFAVLSPSNRYPHPACHLELESSQL